MSMDRRLILLAPEDNVLVAAAAVKAGEIVEIDGAAVAVAEDLKLGHKLSRHALALGDKVLKYGAPIGSMTAAARPGEHVHLHNMKSNYIPTYVHENQADYLVRRP